MMSLKTQSGSQIAVRRLLLVSAVGVLAASAACNKAKTASNSATGPGSTSGAAGTSGKFYTPPGAVYDVKYTSNTVRMDLPTFQRTLRGLTPDGRVLVFDSSDQQVNSLSEGKVLFVEHVGVRKIVAVSKQGSQLAVGTDAAGLTDFIQDGRIEFSSPFNSSAIPAGARAEANPDPLSGIWGWLFGRHVYAQGICDIGESGLELSGTVDNWQFKVGGRLLDQGNVRFCMSLLKKLASLDAGIRVRGNINGARAVLRALVQNSQMSSFALTSPFSGTADINWAVTTTAPGAGIGEARFKSPPFLKQVIEVGPLPFLLQVNGNVIFKPGFGGKKDAGSGNLQANFSGTGGFSVQGAQPPQQDGQASVSATLQPTTTTSLAPHGVVLALAVPKITVSIGTDSFIEAVKQFMPTQVFGSAEANASSFLAKLFNKPVKTDFFKVEAGTYIQTVVEFDYTGSGPLSLVPCSLTHVTTYVQAGADATLFALKAAGQAEDPHVELGKQTQAFRNPDIPACGQK
jgi:hypothetical protein